MRLRVLYVEGMQRPMLVVDKAGPLTSEQAQFMKGNISAGAAVDVLISQDEIELPQVEDGE